MAPSRSVAASLQRNLVKQRPFTRLAAQNLGCTRTRAWSPQTRSALSSSRIAPPRICPQRAFSTSVARRLASVEEKFNPSVIERESDEVDVCIVGGGKLCVAKLQLYLMRTRSCWIKCCHSTEAIGK